MCLFSTDWIFSDVFSKKIMKFRRGRGIHRTHKLLKSWTVQMFWKFLSVNHEGGFDFWCPAFFLLITRLYKNHNLNGPELVHQIRVHGFNQPKYMMHNFILLIEANFKIKPRFDFFQLYLCLLCISNLMEWCIWQHISMKHAHLLLIASASAVHNMNRSSIGNAHSTYVQLQ